MKKACWKQIRKLKENYALLPCTKIINWLEAGFPIKK